MDVKLVCLFAVLLVALPVASCGNGHSASLATQQESPVQTSLEAGPDALDHIAFPGPEDLAPGDSPRTATSIDVQTLNGAEEYRKSPNANDNVNHLTLEAAAAEISWGMYRFAGFADEDTPQSLQVEFASPLPETYYLGLADFNLGAWRWHVLGGGHTVSTSVTDEFTLPLGPRYISPTGHVFAVVLVYDNSSATVYTVTLTSDINDQSPVAGLSASPHTGNAPLEVFFDASSSTDKGGLGIVEYRYDWDGDGIADKTSTFATSSHTYAERGEYHPRVTVVDGDGLTDTAELKVTVQGWVHSWGEGLFDQINAVAVDEAGDVYSVGEYSEASGSVLIAKYGRFGSPRWVKAGGGVNGSDALHAIQRMADGSLLAVGETYVDFGVIPDLLLLNFNAAGDVLGAWTWGGTDNDGGFDLQLRPDGSIYICGRTRSFGESAANALTLKLDSSLNVLWARSWGPATSDTGYKIRTDLQGNAYVLVVHMLDHIPSEDFIVLKYDPDGGLLWSKKYQMAGDIGAYGMDLDIGGNVYITGCDDSPSEKLLLVKFDKDGGLVWQKTWDSTEACGYDIVVSGGFMAPVTIRMTGFVSGFSAKRNVLLLKTDGNGVPSLELSFVAPEHQYGNCLIRGHSAELIIGGRAPDNSGIWLSTPGTVSDAGGLAGDIAAGTTFINNTSLTPLELVLQDVAGVVDTGAGDDWDAVTMAFFEDDL